MLPQLDLYGFLGHVTKGQDQTDGSNLMGVVQFILQAFFWSFEF